MNRWWGSSKDSDQQAADRASRAARRTINSLPLPSSSDDEEGEYRDCDTSLLFGNVDGADDVDSEDEMTNAAAAAAAELARQRELPVDQADFENDSESWKKELKLKFQSHDVEYWFNAIEAEMKTAGINRQWDKKNAIVPLLPDEIVEELKPLLRLTQADAGAAIYKAVKEEILTLFGAKEEDTFKKAISLKMTGRPSAFGKKLIHIICPGVKPFEGCHCARMVYGFWEAQLSPPIKTALADLKFSKDTYQAMFKLADKAWAANGGETRTPAVVAAVNAEASTTTSTDEPSVAAFSARGRGARGGRGGRGNRGNRGGGRGGQNNSTTYNNNNSSNQNASNSSSNASSTNQNKSHQRGPKHPDLPASAKWACAQHWKKGRGAAYCSDPLVCEWKDVIAART